MAVADRVLAREQATFEKHKSQLIAQYKGKYVVIHGDEILSIAGTYEDALGEGYDKVGIDEPFMVRQILEREPKRCVYLGSVKPC